MSDNCLTLNKLAKDWALDQGQPNESELLTALWRSVFSGDLKITCVVKKLGPKQSPEYAPIDGLLLRELFQIEAMHVPNMTYEMLCRIEPRDFYRGYLGGATVCKNDFLAWCSARNIKPPSFLRPTPRRGKSKGDGATPGWDEQVNQLAARKDKINAKEEGYVTRHRAVTEIVREKYGSHSATEKARIGQLTRAFAQAGHTWPPKARN